MTTVVGNTPARVEFVVIKGVDFFYDFQISREGVPLVITNDTFVGACKLNPTDVTSYPFTFTKLNTTDVRLTIPASVTNTMPVDDMMTRFMMDMLYTRSGEPTVMYAQGFVNLYRKVS